MLDDTVRILELQDSLPHQVGGHCSIKCLGVGPAESLVISEEVPLATEKFLRHNRDATSGAKAVVMKAGTGSAIRVVVPCVPVPVVVEVILVNCAVPLIGASLGHHGHLRPRGAVEVGGLIAGANLEFLNAVYRRRHYTGWSSAAGRGNIGVHDTARRAARPARP